jgi:hypothetical protein
VAVRRVADENRSNQLAVANGELLVDAQRPILEANRLGVLFAPIAGGEYFDALAAPRAAGCSSGCPETMTAETTFPSSSMVIATSTLPSIFAALAAGG